MKYAYQRDGARILDWRTGPPVQSRAGETRSLGSLGGGSTLDHPTLTLPAPGAPEPLSGCKCSGSCGCGPGLSGFADAVPGGYLTLGIGALVLWGMLKKRRRR